MPCPLLPPGFRFHPTDEELITHYLKKKFSSPLSPLLSIIANIDLYKFNPWELPGTSLGKALFGEDEWFFFTPRDRKYPNGVRPNRTAGSGYWKATGADKPILNSSGMQCIGVKKVLVFYQGYPRKGMKTDWIMHEYRLLDDNHTHPRIKGSMRLDEWVLCRVRQKSNNPKQIGTCSEDTSLNGIHQPIFPYSNDAQIYKHAQEEEEDLKMEHSLRNYLNFEEEDQPSKLISKSTTDHRSNCINSLSNEEEMVTLKRTISFVSFGQAFPLSPSERLHSDAVPADNMEDSSIFQICYLSNCV